MVCSESNSRSNVFQISRASACVPSRWKVLSGEFRRRPTALVIKFRKPDRVGRRGLSEPREDFSRLPTNAWTQKWFVQSFGSGLIRPWAQTCMDSKVVRAVFWQRTDSPPGSNMLRRAAQTCSACKLAGVQIIPLPTVANQILARTFFRFV